MLNFPVGIKSNLQKAKTIFFKDGATGFFFRMLASYLLCLIGTILISDNSIMNFEFFKVISLLILCAGVLVVFVLLSLIPKTSIIICLTLCLSVIYCYLAIASHKDIHFLFGCIALLSVLILFTDLKSIHIVVPNKLFLICMSVVFLAATLAIGITCILHFNSNYITCYDFGIFAQMYYYMKETLLQLVTCERDGLLSHFAVHVSPIFYLLLPFYFLIPDPRTLLILQCAVTFSGLIPLVLLCRRYKISNLASLAFSVCYVLYPSFNGACFYYLHENNFLPPTILWLILALEWERDPSKSQKQAILKKILCFVAMLLVLFVKEDAPVYSAVIALYFCIIACKEAFSKKQWRDLLKNPAPWIFLISVIYFVIVVKLLSTVGDGAMTNRYGNYIYDGSGRLSVMLIAILKNPIYVITQCATPEKLLFLSYMFLPLGFLPLFTKKLENWTLLIPLVLFNLMSSYPYQSSINAQYAFGSGVLLIFLAVKNYKKMNPSLRKKLLTLSVASSILLYGFHFGTKLQFLYNGYFSEHNKEYRRIMSEAYEAVPADASIAANTFLVPAFSQRAEIYELETTSQLPEYYAIDLRRETTKIETFAENPDYEQVYYAEGAIAIYRYIDWKPGLQSPKKQFCSLAYDIHDRLEKCQKEGVNLNKVDVLTIGGVDVRRVTEDQHWTQPTEDGSTEAVFIADANGVFIYMSLRNGDFVTTWSGPSEDEHYATSSGGWCNGNGAGWTGEAR